MTLSSPQERPGPRQKLGLEEQHGPRAWLTPLAAIAVAAAGAAILRIVVPVTRTVSDATYYRALASGAAVPRPFAFRILAPRIAAAVAALTHRSVDWGFHVLGLVSAFVLLFCLVLPLLQSSAGSARLRGTLLAGILLTPVIPAFWADLYLPDLLHAALLAIYLLLLRARLWFLAAALLPLLFLARESTILLAIVAVLVLGRMVSRRVGLLHAAAALAGWILSQRAGNMGLDNERGLGNAAYLLGKVPHNLLKNVFGASLWTEPMDGPRPPYLWTVPPWLHLGHIHRIGLVGVGFDLAFSTFLVCLCTFGVGVAILWLVWERRSEVWATLRAQTFLTVAAVYGLLSFALAPALGPSVDRLFAYAWPLFFLALPALLPRILHRPTPRGIGALLLLLHVGLGLLPGLVRYARPTLPVVSAYPHLVPLLFAIGSLCWAVDLLRPYTFRSLHPRRRQGLSPPPAATQR